MLGCSSRTWTLLVREALAVAWAQPRLLRRLAQINRVCDADQIVALSLRGLIGAFQDEGAQWLASSLCGLPKLRQLDLRSTYITDNGWFQLVIKLVQHTDYPLFEPETGVRVLHSQRLPELVPDLELLDIRDCVYLSDEAVYMFYQSPRVDDLRVKLSGDWFHWLREFDPFREGW